jgi:hypothetical protein
MLLKILLENFVIIATASSTWAGFERFSVIISSSVGPNVCTISASVNVLPSYFMKTARNALNESGSVSAKVPSKSNSTA